MTVADFMLPGKAKLHASPLTPFCCCRERVVGNRPYYWPARAFGGGHAQCSWRSNRHAVSRKWKEPSVLYPRHTRRAGFLAASRQAKDKKRGDRHRMVDLRFRSWRLLVFLKPAERK